jgi:hypothetical protein
VTASIRSKALYKLRRLIAASTTFQTVVGAANATAALDSIYILEATDKDDEDPRPRAIVRFGNEFNVRQVGTRAWAASGTVGVCFEFDPDDTAATKAANLLVFAELVGEIINECRALAGTGNDGDGETYLNAVEWSAASGPPDYCAPQHENGESYLIDDYTVRWEG